MKITPLLVLVGLGFASVTHSLAAEPPASFEDRLKAFRKTAATALAAKFGAGPADRRLDSSFHSLTQLSQFSLNSYPPNFQELERTLAGITLLAPDNVELAQAAEGLVATAKAEHESRIATARAGMDAVLAQVGQSCLAATNAADLDATLAKLAPYSRQAGYDRRQEDPESWQRGANAYRFVCRWQDYLAARGESPSGEKGVNILRELSSSLDPALMPRSAMLALITPPAPSAEGKSTADSVAKAVAVLEASSKPEALLAALRSLPRVQFGNQSGGLQSLLVTLLEERHQVMAGARPQSLFSNESQRQLSPKDPAYTEGVQNSLLAFRRQTQLEAVRRAFPRATSLPSPAVDESPEAYLLRIAEQFAAARDWPQTRDALETHRLFFGGNRPLSSLSADIDSLGSYLGALNLDRAEQHGPAIVAYQRALRSGGRFLPVDDIAARLSAIKKDHPEAFTELPAETPSSFQRSSRPGAPNTPGEPYTTPSLPRGPAVPRPAPTGPQTQPAPASS